MPDSDRVGNRLQGAGRVQVARGRRARPWETLRGRLALGSLVGLLVASAVFTLVGASLISANTERTARSELDRQAVVLAELISEDAERAAREGRVFRFLPSGGVETLVGRDTRLYFTGLALSPGADSPTAEIPAVVVDRLDYQQLESNGVQRFDFDEPGTGRFTQASAAPVTVGGETAGAILLSRPPGEFGLPLATVLWRALIASAIGMAVAAALLLFLTGRVTRPLRSMQSAAREVAKGNLTARVEPGGTVELNEVSAAFNAMVDQLARREATTRDFLMRITHDLRTPLTAIRGHATALADGVVPEDQVPRSLAAIEGEAERLEAMVSDLLDLARLEADRFRVELAEVEPQPLLRRAFDAHEAEAQRRGIGYEQDIPDLGAMITDGARLSQIVANLLDNALRWTPPGGTVLLEASAGRGGGLVVAVSDTGPGVPADRRDAIFEPFQSAETPDGRRGSGLGLAISRQLARALGGDVTVEPRPSGGSRFALRLPAERTAGVPTA